MPYGIFIRDKAMLRSHTNLTTLTQSVVLMGIE
jgi:hypothetical protein